MTEKEIYEIYDNILRLTDQLDRLVPDTDTDLPRKTSMYNCSCRVKEAISNMARIANASQEVINESR